MSTNAVCLLWGVSFGIPLGMALTVLLDAVAHWWYSRRRPQRRRGR